MLNGSSQKFHSSSLPFSHRVPTTYQSDFVRVLFSSPTLIGDLCFVFGCIVIISSCLRLMRRWLSSFFSCCLLLWDFCVRSLLPNAQIPDFSRSHLRALLPHQTPRWCLLVLR